MAHKIIIDTDAGIDDAMAIAFALGAPELEVLGLTTVFGNVHTEVATLNALRLLEMAGRRDVPVARGAGQPLCTTFDSPAVLAHGVNGQGNVELAAPASTAIDRSAAQFIIDEVMALPGQVTLVAIGPLSNLALALRLEPMVADYVRAVVLMGGSAFAPGTLTPAAERNMYNDPEAADVVFGADWPVTMVGLDVTLQVIMTAENLAQYAVSRKPIAQHIARIVPFYQAYAESRFGIEGIYVHDASAVAYVVQPELFATQAWPVRVETQGISRGKTWPYTRGKSATPPDWADRRAAHVCIGVEASAVRDLILRRSV